MKKKRIARIVVLVAAIASFIACMATEKATVGVPLMLLSFFLVAVYLIMAILAIVRAHKKRKEEANTVHIYAEIITPNEKDKATTDISQYVRK